MKKKKITYGVSGMMEYQALIRVGRSQMRIHFTDGSLSAMGVNPAKFTTSNYMIQHMIEHSEEFKRGLIFRYNEIELAEEVEIFRPTLRASPNGGGADNEAESKESAGEGGLVGAASPDDKPADAREGATGGRVEVEFSNNEDARDYLEEHYGAVRSRLRTRNDILAFGEAHNVAISFE